MDGSLEHISICVCTYKRIGLLNKLLVSLENLSTDGLFNYSMVVVDNDFEASAGSVIESFISNSPISLQYFVEPKQNIALARNKAVENAIGNYIAFIDDDEVPNNKWLITLYNSLAVFQTDGVLGPVLPRYETPPPDWIVRGKFYERLSHETGTILDWRNTRTGNVLLKRAVFENGSNVFREEFGSGGEDRDFFRRAIQKGYRFSWCSEAPVYEEVTAVRCRRSFMLKRALLRGQLPHFSSIHYLQSLIAIPLYTSLLPFLFLAGHHLFMKFLIKDFDHIGRLLGALGINVIKEKYVLE